MRTKNILKSFRNQEKRKTHLPYSFLSEIFINNPHSLFKQLTTLEIKCLDLLLFRNNRSYNGIFKSDTFWMARKLGCRREQISRITSKFARLGILTKKQLLSFKHNVWRPCIYRLATIFNDMNFRNKLAQWLSVCRKMNISQIVYIYNKFLLVLRTHNKLKVNNLLSLSPFVSLSTCARANGFLFKKELTKELEMRNEQYEALSRLSCFERFGKRLSPVGIHKLMIFPVEAIAYATQCLNSKKQVRNCFSYFISVANSWCKERLIELDWTLLYKTLEYEGLDPHADCLEAYSVLSVPSLLVKPAVSEIQKRKELSLKPVRSVPDPVSYVESVSPEQQNRVKHGFEALSQMIDMIKFKKADKVSLIKKVISVAGIPES